MSPKRWGRIEDVYHSALERALSERATFLDMACDGDEELRREVESLLRQGESQEALIDRPVWEAAEELLETRTAELPRERIGDRISHYEILQKLGEGGMGAVYKARDTRLGRLVAIKTLPKDKMGDPARKRRFMQEARAASALNHPNIITVYEIDRVDCVDFIAMEYVEGRTLEDLLVRKRLPLGRALEYSIQVAGALAAAHTAGIVHRDLKPANIMVTDAGQVKLLDFGVAKLTQPQDETVTGASAPLKTEEGALIGTTAYMSPEQAEGKPVDARSDIFSFGAVLYEILTGRRAFQKDSTTSTLGAIIHKEPEPLGSGVPHDLEKVVKRCLHKDRAHRFQHMDDVKVALEELKEEADSGNLVRAAVVERKRSRKWMWVPAVAVGALLLAVGLVWRLREAPPSTDLRPVALTAYEGVESAPAFSPDGSKVAFAWNGGKGGNYDIYVKQIGSSGPPMRLTSSPLDENFPAWSPDDRWIAFRRQQQGSMAVILIPPLGGPERKLTEMASVMGESWTPDSKWLVLAGRDSLKVPLSIWAISVETGERRQLTSPPGPSPPQGYFPGDVGPSISPDGRTLAFARQIADFVTVLYAQRLTRDLRPAEEPVRVGSQSYPAFNGIAWTADGREVVYSAGGFEHPSLWRVPVSGAKPPVRLPYVLPTAGFPAIARTASRLVYRWSVYSRAIWRLDIRTGERKVLIGSTYENMLPQYSPDGRKIALGSNRSGDSEVWTCDADGGDCQQLTFFGGPLTGTPRWSPDGRRLAFDSRAEGQPEIYIISADGGAPRRMTSDPAIDSLPSWSRDGRWIYFTSGRSGTSQVWKIPADGGDAVQVTRSGGNAPLESPDGYLYYAKGAGRSPLFRMPAGGGAEEQVLTAIPYWRDFAVSPKGIYFFTLDQRTIQLRDAATGKLTVLATLDRPAVDLCLSPDDAYLLWSQVDRDTTDLMLVENFR